MKYAIICKEKFATAYICFIGSKENADEYMIKIPIGIKAEIVKINCDKYPVYIIEETTKPLVFTSDYNDILKKIKNTKKRKGFDDGDSYFIYYKLTHDFSAQPHGIDKMGSMEHAHITNHDLDNHMNPI